MSNVKLSRSRCEAKLLSDYESVLGSTIVVDFVSGYVGDTQIEMDGSFKVRVVKTPKADLLHETDDGWFDPYWNVVPVGWKPTTKEGHVVSGLWTHGWSYQCRE